MFGSYGLLEVNTSAPRAPVTTAMPPIVLIAGISDRTPDRRRVDSGSIALAVCVSNGRTPPSRTASTS